MKKGAGHRSGHPGKSKTRKKAQTPGAPTGRPDPESDDLVALGRRRRDEGDLHGALEAFEAALPARSNDPEFLFGVAGLMRELNMHADALVIYDALAAALPDVLPIIHNRANCLADLGRAEEALAAFRGILRLDSEVTQPWAGMGNAAFAAEKPDLGAFAYRRAIALEPGRPASYVNFAEGLVADAVGEGEQAVTLVRRAMALVPDDSKLRHNLARSLLSLGRFDEGWAQYEGRLHSDLQNYVTRAIACPRWQGEPLAGRHLFVCGEQGLGDQLWLVPFIRAAAAEAGRVTVEVVPKLIPLLCVSLPEIEVRPLQVMQEGGNWYAVGESRTGPEDADLYIEAGSLPRFLWDRVAGHTAPPVLKPDPALVGQWRDYLDRKGPGLRVGICWRSSLSTRERSPEYLPIDAWRPIFDTLSTHAAGPVHFYRLQHGDVDADIVRARQSLGVGIERVPDLDLWDDIHGMAAFMANLDVVVTALTATARIGAGLGIPTLVLMKTPYFVGLSDGRDPVGPALEPVFQGPGRPWPEGVVNEVAARLASRLRESAALPR